MSVLMKRIIQLPGSNASTPITWLLETKHKLQVFFWWGMKPARPNKEQDHLTKRKYFNILISKQYIILCMCMKVSVKHSHL